MTALGPSQHWGQKLTESGKVFRCWFPLYIRLTWVLLLLNQYRPYPNSRLLAILSHSFSATISMKKKKINSSGQEGIFYNRLLPQAPSLIAVIWQSAAKRVTDSSCYPLLICHSLPVHYSEHSSGIDSFSHLKYNCLLPAGFSFACNLLWFQDGAITVLCGCLLCICEWDLLLFPVSLLNKIIQSLIKI